MAPSARHLVSAGLLEGIRVIDLSRVLAGPWCAQLLADYGADVIKVEEITVGDDTRAFGPPFVSLSEEELDDDDDTTTVNSSKKRREEAAYFLAANRGKRSIAVNIKTKEGQEIIRQLVASADVFVENFKVGGLAKYGLDYESLRAVNPELVYCSITGFGQTGPLAKRAGYDAMIQGMSGLMSITGEPDHTPGGGPQKVGVAVADIFTGLYATTAILAALFRVKQAKALQAAAASSPFSSSTSIVQGEHIDVSLLETQIAVLANQAMNCLVTGEAPRRMGTAHPNIVPYRSVPTKDGHLMLAVGNDDQFRRFAEAIGAPELALDECFRSNAGRVHHRAKLDPIIDKLMLLRSKSEWISLLEACGVPCGPINNIEEALQEPQVVHRQLVQSLPYPAAGADATLRVVGNPVKFSSHPVSYSKAPPLHGEHTEEILSEILNFSSRQMQALYERRIVGL